MAFSMKKTFYYNFSPTKAEELEEAEQGSSSNGEKKIPRVLVEIQDLPGYNPPPPPMLNDPRRIVKTVSASEVTTGVLFLSFSETFEHVFRYWDMHAVSYVVNSYNKFPVTIWDVTDCDHCSASVYGSDHGMFLQSVPRGEYYALGCMALIRNRSIKFGDEVGIAWDNMGGKFVFQLLSRSTRGGQQWMQLG